MEAVRISGMDGQYLGHSRCSINATIVIIRGRGGVLRKRKIES